MKNIKWEQVISYNDLDQRPLINWINLGNGTMFRISAFFCHGDWSEPKQGFQVSIERVGCYLFSRPLTSGRFYGEYVGKKLGLGISDSNIIADWMNAQWEIDAPIQGEYDERYILDNEPYALMGENKIIPLCAEILD